MNAERCYICGKFIGAADFNRGHIEADRTVNIDTGEEGYVYAHRLCKAKDAK